MKDSKAREELAELRVRLENLSTLLDKVDVDNYDFRDYKRQFKDLVKELGFSFDDDKSLNRDAVVNSSLGRLQAQITALVEASGFKETYVDGTLRYEKAR
jgi:hypothetical protein